jgi:hypothetical protein
MNFCHFYRFLFYFYEHLLGIYLIFILSNLSQYIFIICFLFSYFSHSQHLVHCLISIISIPAPSPKLCILSGPLGGSCDPSFSHICRFLSFLVEYCHQMGWPLPKPWWIDVYGTNTHIHHSILARRGVYFGIFECALTIFGGRTTIWEITPPIFDASVHKFAHLMP